MTDKINNWLEEAPIEEIFAEFKKEKSKEEPNQALLHLLRAELVNRIDDHDCTVSEEDGCDCQEIKEGIQN